MDLRVEKETLLDGCDYIISATSKDLRSVDRILALIRSEKDFQKMLDVGCGRGGLTRYVSAVLGISEIHGIDIDEKRLDVARNRGIIVHKIDVNTEMFPFPDQYFDLVTSFGVIEHLVYYDNLIREAYRVLKKNGFFILSMPNLGSYINRVALLLGYQPRDVEISREIVPGILPIYGQERCAFHLHSATLQAMKELLNFYNFQIISIKPLSPSEKTAQNRLRTKIVYILDKTLGKFSSLSRRFIILAKK